MLVDYKLRLDFGEMFLSSEYPFKILTEHGCTDGYRADPRGCGLSVAVIPAFFYTPPISAIISQSF